MIPRLRAYLLIIRLKGSVVFNQQAIERLKGALPSCSRAVLFDERVIGIATRTEYDPPGILQHYAAVLRPFENVTVLELGRLSASTYGLAEPFHFWMETNIRVPGSARREGDNAEDVMKAKWGQRRGENSENRSIADAIGKVFPDTRGPRK